MANPNTQQQLMQMIGGYWVSQIVSALAQLGIPDRLARGPLPANRLAAACGCDPQATLRLMRAAASVGVLSVGPDGSFSLTPVGELLRADTPDSMRDLAIALTAPGHWLPWGRLSAAVKEGACQTTATLGCDVFEHFARNPAEGAAFTGAMANLSRAVAEEAARLVDTSAAKIAVDVGGASGTVIAALLRKNPALEGILFDIPHVAESARQTIAGLGLASRCKVIEGDFFQSVPQADLYILKHIVHDWNDAQATRILTNCARALRHNGRILLMEMLLPEDDRPSPAPLMDVNMLVMAPGRERTAKEYAGLLDGAGLHLDRVIETQSPTQIMEASARA